MTSPSMDLACSRNLSRVEGPLLVLSSLGFIALALTPGRAFADANGNGSLQLCPLDGSGRMMGVGSSAPTSLSCSKGGASFALNNNGNDTGGNGFAGSTAQVAGYSDGRLVLKGNGGVSIIGAATFDSTASFGNNRVTGVRAAELSVTSTDAVNGSQLAATNSSVATNAATLSAQINRTTAIADGVAVALGGGSSIDPVTGKVKGPAYEVDGKSVSSVGEAVTSLDARATSSASRITAIDGRVEQLASGKSGLLQQRAPGASLMVGSATDGDQVDFAGTGGPRRLSGIAQGRIAEGSDEAVTGSQLAAANADLAVTSSALSVQVTRSAKANEGLADALGGGASVDPLTGAISAPAYTVDGKSLSTVGAALTNLDDRVSAGSSSITTINGRLDGLASGTSGLVQQAAPGAGITLGAATDGDLVNVSGTAGARRVSGVAAGTVAAESAEAINGAQLAATNANVATNAAEIVIQSARTGAMGEALANALGGDALVDPATGAITSPRYTVDGKTLSSVGAAVTSLDARATVNAVGIKTLSSRVNQLADGTSGLVLQASRGAVLTVGEGTDGHQVNFTGTSGARTLAGVAAGKVAVDSAEAINGAQLAATNAEVASNAVAIDAHAARSTTAANGIAATLGGGASVDPSTGNVIAPSFNVDGKSVSNVGTAIANLDGRTTGNSSDIRVIRGRLDGLSNGTSGLVQQASPGAMLTVGADADGRSVDFAGSAGTRTLAGVAAGRITADSTEAVNGSQLAATNADVAANMSHTAQNSTSIVAINGRLDGFASGTLGLVQHSSAGAELTVGAATDGSAVSFAGNSGARRLLGIKAGSLSADSTEAVNGSQLMLTNSEVAANAALISAQASRTASLGEGLASSLGGGARVDGVTGAVTAPSYMLDGTSVSNIGTALTNLDGRTIANTSSITSINGRLDGLSTGSAGLVQQAAPGAALTVGAGTDGARVDFSGTAGSRKLIGIAAGQVEPDSTEAINGSQLAVTNYDVAQNTAAISTQVLRAKNLGEGTANALGGGATVDPLTGALSSPTYVLDGKSVSGVGEALTNLDGRTAINTSSISTISGRLDGLASGAAGLVQQVSPGAELTVGSATDGDQVSFTGTAGVRKLTGIAAGAVSADSTDAVSGAQLAATNAEVTANTAAVSAQVVHVKNLGDGIANALGGGSNVDPLTGALTTPTYVMDGKSVSGVGAALSNLDGRTTINASSIATISGRLDGIASGSAGLVQQLTSDGLLTVGAATEGTQVNFRGTAGARVLAGLAAARITADSDEAVTGSQLSETNVRVSAAERGLEQMDGRLIKTESNVSSLFETVTNLAGGSVGLVTQADPGAFITVGAGVAGKEVDFAGTDGHRRLTGVANGVKDADVVTMAQLRAAGALDPTSGELLSVLTYDNSSLGRATFGGADGTILANVGRGLIAMDSTEAVNGAQVYDLRSMLEGKIEGLSGRVGAVESTIAEGGLSSGSVSEADQLMHRDGSDSIAVGEGASATGRNSVAIGSGSIAKEDGEVSVGAQGAERRVSNVAAGVAATDAVNLQQVSDFIQAERNWASQRFRDVDKRIDRMGAISAAYAGMALNTAGLSGDNRVGAGIGSQNGRSALAVGYQRIIGEKKNVSISLGGAFSGSDRSVSGGAGFSW